MERLELIAMYCDLRTKADAFRLMLQDAVVIPGPAKDVEYEGKLWDAALPGLRKAEDLAGRIADRLRTALTDEEYDFARYCIENGHDPYEVQSRRSCARYPSETPYLGD